jgi:hypothetical protein
MLEMVMEIWKHTVVGNSLPVAWFKARKSEVNTWVLDPLMPRKKPFGKFPM